MGDYNDGKEKHAHSEGAYVALSDDDGATWTQKRLPPDMSTVGYTTATQTPDGVVHVVTSKNKPNYEIELNEAWVLDKNVGAEVASADSIGDVKSFTEHYLGGVIVKATWSAGHAADGRVLLDGPESFFYPNGKLMWSVRFHAGRKTGQERFLRVDGTPVWEKEYASDGTWTWKSFDRDGNVVATSNWRGKTLLSSDAPDPPARKKSSDVKPQEPDAE